MTPEQTELRNAIQHAIDLAARMVPEYPDNPDGSDEYYHNRQYWAKWFHVRSWLEDAIKQFNKAIEPDPPRCHTCNQPLTPEMTEKMGC